MGIISVTIFNCLVVTNETAPCDLYHGISPCGVGKSCAVVDGIAKCICDNKHWGQDCANNCTCTDNAAKCNAANGSCICKPGWEGDRCQTDVDECSADTTVCSGFANTECHNVNGSYSCNCQSGYVNNTNGICQGIMI